MDGKRALISLALALALVVACGGAPAGSAGAGASAGASTAATATPAASSGTGAATGAPSAGGPRLSEVLSAARSSQYKVTYKYTLTGAGAGVSGEQSWYFKPPKARFDFSSNLGGQTTVISFFTLPDGSYYCMSLGTTKTCFSLKGAGIGSPMDTNPAAIFQQSMVANPSAYGGVFVENKTFAGQTGACYDVTASAATAGATSGRFCYTKDGILLFENFSAAGSGVTLEATNVSTTVPDSDFDLPAKPSN